MSSMGFSSERFKMVQVDIDILNFEK